MVKILIKSIIITLLKLRGNFTLSIKREIGFNPYLIISLLSKKRLLTYIIDKNTIIF